MDEQQVPSILPTQPPKRQRSPEFERALAELAKRPLEGEATPQAEGGSMAPTLYRVGGGAGGAILGGALGSIIPGLGTGIGAAIGGGLGGFGGEWAAQGDEISRGKRDEFDELTMVGSGALSALPWFKGATGVKEFAKRGAMMGGAGGGGRALTEGRFGDILPDTTSGAVTGGVASPILGKLASFIRPTPAPAPTSAPPTPVAPPTGPIAPKAGQTPFRVVPPSGSAAVPSPAPLSVSPNAWNITVKGGEGLKMPDLPAPTGPTVPGVPRFGAPTAPHVSPTPLKPPVGQLPEDFLAEGTVAMPTKVTPTTPLPGQKDVRNPGNMDFESWANSIGLPRIDPRASRNATNALPLHSERQAREILIGSKAAETKAINDAIDALIGKKKPDLVRVNQPKAKPKTKSKK